MNGYKCARELKHSCLGCKRRLNVASQVSANDTSKAICYFFLLSFLIFDFFISIFFSMRHICVLAVWVRSIETALEFK